MEFTYADDNSLLCPTLSGIQNCYRYILDVILLKVSYYSSVV